MIVPKICPRCQDNWIPTNEHPGQYPGALSRADNKTEICSDCGVAEALEPDGPTVVSKWPVQK